MERFFSFFLFNQFNCNFKYLQLLNIHHRKGKAYRRLHIKDLLNQRLRVMVSLKFLFKSFVTFFQCMSHHLQSNPFVYLLSLHFSLMNVCKSFLLFNELKMHIHAEKSGENKNRSMFNFQLNFFAFSFVLIAASSSHNQPHSSSSKAG